MPMRIGSSIRRALRGSAHSFGEAVHFHVGPEGRPFVCDVAACDSPAVALSELRRGRIS